MAKGEIGTRGRVEEILQQKRDKCTGHPLMLLIFFVSEHGENVYEGLQKRTTQLDRELNHAEG
jgi:hypothetical protein